MPEFYAPAPELYYAACGRIRAVRESVEHWKAQESTDNSDVSKFLMVLARGCDRLRQLADEHLADWKSGQKDRSHIEESLAFLTASAARLSSFIGFLEARDSDRGMPEIALPLRLLIQGIAPASKEHSFIFFATHDFNFYYSDFYQLLRRPLLLSNDVEEKEFLKGLPDQIALVAYSSIERQNILTLIILLHELAHYVDHVLAIGVQAPKIQVAVSELNAWLAEARRIKYVPEELVKQFKSAAKVPKGVLDFYLKYVLLRQVETAPVWVRELIADVLASRILGLGFYLTQKKFLGFFPGDDQGDYPPHYRRFWAIATELLDPQHGVEAARSKGKGAVGNKKQAAALRRVVRTLKAHYKDAGRSHASLTGETDASSTNEQKLLYLRLLARDILEKAIAPALNSSVSAVRAVAFNTRAARVTGRVFEVADLLTRGIAPSQNLSRAISMPPAGYTVQEILIGGWVAWMGTLQDKEDPEDWAERLAGVSRLALRGIELAHFLSQYPEKLSSRPEKQQAQWRNGFRELGEVRRKRAGHLGAQGVLRRHDLVHRMLSRRVEDRLTVSPINHPKQIGESSIDVRLGNAFLVVATTRTPSLVIGSGTKIPPNYYESYKRDLDETLLLHPREFILGSTLEYLSLPLDVMAYVIGRSTLGRLGLVIATATHVAPGYKGTLTLELTNVGTVPIELKPGVRIAQLVFHRLTGSASIPYAGHGRYAFSVGPEIPKI